MNSTLGQHQSALKSCTNILLSPTATALALFLAGCMTPQNPQPQGAKPDPAPRHASTPAPDPKNAAHAAPPSAQSKGWVNLSDGKTLKGWRITDFSGHGAVR